MPDRIEFADGAEYHVGERVLYTGGSEPMEAEIIEIADRFLKLDIEDLDALPLNMVWPLKDGGEFVQPRDHGVPGGHIEKLPTPAFGR